jgi:hypothetical protein
LKKEYVFEAFFEVFDVEKCSFLYAEKIFLIPGFLIACVLPEAAHQALASF